MLNERDLQETIARCVSIAVYYHGGDRTGQTSDRMTAEVRATALALGESGISASEARGRVIEPVRLELLARFGASEGSRIVRDFVDAFAGEDPAAALSPNGRWRSLGKGKGKGKAQGVA